MQMGEFQSVKDFLLRGLPDFCWQDRYEILTMAEQLNEEIEEGNLFVQLCRLVNRGALEEKKCLGANSRPQFGKHVGKGIRQYHSKYKRKSIV
jgi:hypothetical protein